MKELQKQINDLETKIDSLVKIVDLQYEALEKINNHLTNKHENETHNNIKASPY